MSSFAPRDRSGKLLDPQQEDSASPQPQAPPAKKQHQQQQQPKKIRFITSNGAPQAKRRRVSSACTLCRKRKVACTGERPHCNTCLNNNLDCTGYSSEAAPSNPNNEARQDSSRPKLTRTETADSTTSQKRKVVNPQQQHVPPLSSTSSTSKPERGHVISQPPKPLQEPEKDQFERHMPSLFSGSRNRMPYFRWLGPTAIMPGFKQMVVKVNRSSSTTDGVTSPSTGLQAGNSNQSVTLESDARTPLLLPFYDNSSMPPSELITHLCDTFFVHLACNFPFLQRDRFLKDLEEKQVDAILVDAVCALAARFSTHHLVLQKQRDGTPPNHSEQGSAFAQRAKLALLDTFATPNVAAVQAALLIAYNEFGESRDSGLWMYLGIAIRLAQDLGLQKIDGLRYEGREGSNPRFTRAENSREMSHRHINGDSDPEQDEQTAENQRAAERERVDTFWAVFFLDRVVSSGTGRTCTLKDDDIELSFPPLDQIDAKTGWPSPFPALIRIVCLYGRVADLLNGIKEPSDITSETPQQLADMEARVTNFYQGLSPKLHFQAMNFHHYVKAGEGTNFVLLHFWFHTLIVLLHQPTLLKTFEGKMLRLFPNSQALSMSSAKTIADILSYSQLIDTKAGMGNPFTTQPIYIAACAFLKETAEQAATSKEHSRTQSTAPSRATSPHLQDADKKIDVSSIAGLTRSSGSGNDSRPPMVEMARARHTLLATAASQHYQLCYKALQTVETYWGGTKYILTVLEQKFKGVGDPLLYTAEEGESALEQPEPRPSFTSPGWRRKHPWSPSDLGPSFLQTKSSGQRPASGGDTNHQPIGWTLTGSLNSPSTKVAWHFPNNTFQHQQSADSQSMDALLDPFDFTTPIGDTRPCFPQPQQQHPRTYSDNIARPSSQTRHHRPSLPLTNTNQDSLPFPDIGTPNMSLQAPNTSTSFNDLQAFDQGNNDQGNNDPGNNDQVNNDFSVGENTSYTDLLIESQDVDMSLLGLDMLPWFDAPSGDLMPIFDTELQEGFCDDV